MVLVSAKVFRDLERLDRFLIRYCQKFYENPGMRHEREYPEGVWKKDGRFCSGEDSVGVRVFPDGEGIRAAKQPRRFTVL
jgi:hypothetical protein